MHSLTLLLECCDLKGFASSKISVIWQPVVIGIARNLLHLPVIAPPEYSGSGDTNFAYCEAAVLALLCLVSASILALARNTETCKTRLKIYNYLRLLIRIGLAGELFLYGLEKIFWVQMPPLSPSSYYATYGHLSPMAILWNFIGFSRGYSIFSGASEVLTGILLLTETTATTGALMCIAVMTNVFALNLCYDIPVKLRCMHFLAMSLVLLAPDAKRLTLFLLNKTSRATPRRLLFQSSKANLVCSLAQVTLGLIFAWNMCRLDTYYLQKNDPQKIPFYGAWNVDKQILNDEETPRFSKDRIVRIFFDRATFIGWQKLDGLTLFYPVKIDKTKNTIELKYESDGSKTADFRVESLYENSLKLSGQMGSTMSYQFELTRIDMSKLPLRRRKFRWISEYPENW